MPFCCLAYFTWCNVFKVHPRIRISFLCKRRGQSRDPQLRALRGLVPALQRQLWWSRPAKHPRRSWNSPLPHHHLPMSWAHSATFQASVFSWSWGTTSPALHPGAVPTPVRFQARVTLPQPSLLWVGVVLLNGRIRESRGWKDLAHLPSSLGRRWRRTGTQACQG